MDEATHLHDGQQRLLKVLEELSKHLFDGIAAADLARLVGESQTNTFRTLKNLEHAGWAEQRPATKAWCVTPAATRLSHRVYLALAREGGRYLEPQSPR